MGRTTLLICFVMTCAILFATYNTVTMMMSHHDASAEGADFEDDMEASFVDPVLKMPKKLLQDNDGFHLQKKKKRMSHHDASPEGADFEDDMEASSVDPVLKMPKKLLQDNDGFHLQKKKKRMSHHDASPEGAHFEDDMEASFVDPVLKMPKKLLQDNDGFHSQKKKKRLFHVAVTASDSPYNRWQCRIMYYWYKQFQDKPGSEMGGFTRILHSGKPDNLIDKIPTVVVKELPEGMDQGYIVLNRPWAFVQWLQIAIIEEDYIMMAEPDHIFVKPLPNLATEQLPAAFQFSYIEPVKHEKIVRKFFPEHMGPVSRIDSIGNSPTIIRRSQLEKIAPTWMNTSLHMKSDLEADNTFGWVLEMYAYAIASAIHGVKHVLRKDFMIQPPWDVEVAEKYLIHYTYGCDYTMKGVLTYGKVGEWRFDKRSHLLRAPPRNLSLPPPGVPESVVTLMKMLNEATAKIPDWQQEGE